MSMKEDRKDEGRLTKQQEGQSSEGQKHQSPFKDAGGTEPAETPEEEAAAEQQRKEALTERD